MDALKVEAVQKRALKVLLRHIVDSGDGVKGRVTHDYIKLGDAAFLLHMNSDSIPRRKAMGFVGKVLHHLDARHSLSGELGLLREIIGGAFCDNPVAPEDFLRQVFSHPEVRRRVDAPPLTLPDTEVEAEILAVIRALDGISQSVRYDSSDSLVDAALEIGGLRRWADPAGSSQIDELLAGWKRGGLMTAQNNKARQEIPHVFKLWLEYKESGYCKTLYKGVTAFDRECEEQFRGGYDEEKKKWEGPTQLTIQKWRTAWERGGAKTLADAMKLTNAEQRKSKRKPEPAS